MRKIKSTKEIQIIEIDILKHIDFFCRENGIKYFLAYGSLIGAIRHNGFIPWDDDIDIWMLREDYDKFCNSFDKYGARFHLKVINAFSQPRFNRTMSKVINQDTTFKEKWFRDKVDMGVFVDIFPLDGIPEGRVKRFIHLKKAVFLHKLLFAIIKAPELFPWYKKIVHWLVQPLSPEIVVDCMNKLIVKYKNTPKVCSYQTASRTPYEIELFETSIPWKFEEYTFFVPVGYDKILKMTYGDYMKLPPVEERVVGHPANTYWK